MTQPNDISKNKHPSDNNPPQNQSGNIHFTNNAAIRESILIIGSNIDNSSISITNVTRHRACPTPPPPPEHFGGRNSELKALKDRIKLGQVMAISTVQGLGGIGKTALARQAAHELYFEKVFSAVIWADVTRDPNPLSVLLNWALRADPDFTFKDTPLEALALQVKALLENLINEKCEGGRTLVVLDDVWDNGKEAIRLLRLACPSNATVLLTTRSENLAIDLGAYVQYLNRFSLEDGVQMLQTYLPMLNSTLLSELVEVLGGHPLALTLAAKRVLKKRDREKALLEHITEYRKGLTNGTDFFSLHLEQEDSKEDNLTIALSYSYAELAEEDKGHFQALGILAYDQPLIDHS